MLYVCANLAFPVGSVNILILIGVQIKKSVLEIGTMFRIVSEFFLSVFFYYSTFKRENKLPTTGINLIYYHELIL